MWCLSSPPPRFTRFRRRFSSRCQHYNFRRIARTEIVERLRHVVDQDKIVIEERSLMALCQASEGSMRAMG